ncbi:MAG: hypothetical protein LBF27_33195 [Sphingobacterium sp.]|nr:hypothetical protein [Sphingobacterium sp.]
MVATLLYKKYQSLNNDMVKNSLFNEQLLAIKSILSKEKQHLILIISWKKNILVKNGSLYYTALLYNPINGNKTFIKTTEQNPKKEILLDVTTSGIRFQQHLYILENYLEGKEDYLLSVQNSFSSAEMNSPYYIYDFVKKEN